MFAKVKNDIMNNKLPGSDEPAMPTNMRYGLSKIEYACIHLELPDSGTEWLDELIAKKQRQSIAAKAMEGILSNEEIHQAVIKTAKSKNTTSDEVVSGLSIELADTLLSQLNKK